MKGSDYVKKRVTYTLDDKLIKRLQEYSEKTMIPQAKVVNEAITQYLDKMESTEK